MGEQVSVCEQRRHLRGLPRRCPSRGTGPGVIVIQEWWGLVGHITDVADRFAAEGFVALAPDFYHGAEHDRARRGHAAAHGPRDGHRPPRTSPAPPTYLPAAPRSRVAASARSASAWAASLALWTGTLAPQVIAAVGFYPAVPWERMSPCWSNYEGKDVVIHCSEEDGTSAAEGIQSAVARHRGGRWDGRRLRLPGHAPRVLQRRAARGPRRRSQRARLDAHPRPAARLA